MENVSIFCRADFCTVEMGRRGGQMDDTCEFTFSVGGTLSRDARAQLNFSRKLESPLNCHQHSIDAYATFHL